MRSAGDDNGFDVFIPFFRGPYTANQCKLASVKGYTTKHLTCLLIIMIIYNVPSYLANILADIFPDRYDYTSPLMSSQKRFITMLDATQNPRIKITFE